MTSLYDRFHEVGMRLVRPTAAQRDRACSWDRGLWRELASTGLFALDGTQARAEALQGLAAGSLDLGFSVSACAQITALEALERFGSAEQKEELAPRLRSGAVLVACANAEPRAGTDLMGMQSRAARSGDGFVLSSRKRSITNLGAADIALVSARVDGAPPHQAVNVFIVDCAGPRTYIRPREDLMGLRTSPTGTLLCHRAPLPGSALLGQLGAGFEIFRMMFSIERLYTGHLYLAAIRACLQRGLDFAETRVQFGAPIGKNQYVQEKIVKMRVAEELLAAHLHTTAARYVAGEDVFGSLSIIKTFGIERAIEAAQDLVRLLGSRGLSTEEPAERLLRDLLGLSILGGTVELQKIVIYNEAAKARRVNAKSQARS